jgi:dephospho-CoA kinase
VAARDHSAPETIDAIIAAQPTRAARLALADDIIDNSGLPTALDKQVETLHQQYLRFADYD